MKQIFSTLLLGVLCFGAQAQTKTAAQIAKEKANDDTLQYALGAYVMKNLEKNGVVISNQAMFKKAIDDVLANRKLMVNEGTLESRISATQTAVRAQQGLLMEQMLFKELSKQSGVVRMPSGVNYAVVVKGSGPKPDLQDTVVVNVKGVLPDGTVFLDSEKGKESFLILIKDLVPGLQDAVLRMSSGSVWRVYVPAGLGFGQTGNGTTVPPNTPLIYDIGLVSVRAGKQ